MSKHPDQVLSGLQQLGKGIGENNVIKPLCFGNGELTSYLNCLAMTVGNGVNEVGRFADGVERTIDFYGQLTQSIVNNPEILPALLSSPNFIFGVGLISIIPILASVSVLKKL